MKSWNYKPLLTSDINYIEKVKNTTNNYARYDIDFEILSNFFHDLWLWNPYDFVNLNALWSQELEAMIEKSYRIIESKWLELWEEKLDPLRSYLSQEDKLAPADLIFGFGWWWQARYDSCIDLFKSLYAKKILFSWNIPFGAQHEQCPEYEYFYNKTQEEGISDESIILEKEASNTLENVVFSISKLKDIWFLPGSIILVNLPFTMRRSYYTLKANIDRECNIIRYCAQWKYNKKNRYLEFNGYKFILYEYIKMYGARLMGHI